MHAHGFIPADPALEQEFCVHDAWGKAGPRLYLAERPSGLTTKLQFFTFFFFLHLLCKIVCLLFRPSALVASLCLIVLVVGSFLFLRLTSYTLLIGVDTDKIPLDALELFHCLVIPFIRLSIAITALLIE